MAALVIAEHDNTALKGATRALEAAYVAMANQYLSQLRAPIRIDAHPPR